jgi:hypothetical protein
LQRHKFLLVFELQVVNLAVETMLGQEVGVRAAFNDAALVKY